MMAGVFDFELNEPGPGALELQLPHHQDNISDDDALEVGFTGFFRLSVVPAHLVSLCPWCRCNNLVSS